MKRHIPGPKLLLRGLATAAIIISAPHLLAYSGDSFPFQTFSINTIEAWFTWINDELFFTITIAFFIFELIRYTVLKRMSWNLISDSITNIITFLTFIAIEAILGFLFITQLYFFAYENSILPHLPLNWITVIFAIIIADFIYYWEHRMMHRISIGWMTHTVHHSSPHFNMSVAYRFGPLDWLFPLLLSVPIAFLGVHPILIFSVEVFVQVFQTILHTEAIKKLPRPIEYIFNTPSHHRVHHGANRQYWDTNYAGIFIIWDRMFGTFVEEKEKVIYGVDEQLNSTNPWTVFFHGFSRFWRDLKKVPGMHNKFIACFKYPGWQPTKK